MRAIMKQLIWGIVVVQDEYKIVSIVNVHPSIDISSIEDCSYLKKIFSQI